MRDGERKISIGGKITELLNYTLLILLNLSIILPFIHILALSLNDGHDAARGGILFWPRQFSFVNYIEVFKNGNIIQSYGITLFRTVIGTIFGLLLTSMAAYALKSKTLPGKNKIMIMILITMLFNGGIVPYYMVLRTLNLTNTIWVYVVPMLYNAWNIFLMKSFFETISISLEESAKLDGANEIKIFFKIILPLSKPVLAVIALFIGVAHWNDWFSGTFYVQDNALRPIQTLLRDMMNSQEILRNSLDYVGSGVEPKVTGESLKMSTIIIATLPIICVYPFIQKYFVKGIMIGAVKG